MNFLAHLYLTQNPPGLMVGNFIGDFVKGQDFKNYPNPIQQGILLHREIDAFTDENIWVRKSKKRLSPKYRHYSAVIVDMFYDHYLAVQWNKFHHQKLEEFAADTYITLKKFWDILPKGAQFMLPYMIKHDWLKSYAATSGLDRALSGLARRSRFTSYMEEATADLLQNYEEYKDEFSAFFPLLVNYVTEWKRDNNII